MKKKIKQEGMERVFEILQKAEKALAISESDRKEFNASFIKFQNLISEMKSEEYTTEQIESHISATGLLSNFEDLLKFCSFVLVHTHSRNPQSEAFSE